MNQNENYVPLSLELHLFFARIMKEHSLFLKAGFTPVDASFSKEAEFFKQEFEKLLEKTIVMANGIVSQNVLSSGEVVTEFTAKAESQTMQFTGIKINEMLTMQEQQLKSGENPQISMELMRSVRMLNQMAIRLLNGLICFKEKILERVLHCRMFTMYYPLLIEHILREAKLYRSMVLELEGGKMANMQSLKDMEMFWNNIMMEHALFIRGLLDPSENNLIETSNDFAMEYKQLLEMAMEANDQTMLRTQSLQETIKFQEFKTAGTKGIQNCQIRSIILPLLADHVLREANHYIRILSE